MVNVRDEVNKQVKSFLEYLTDNKVEIYNANFISRVPLKNERIEFRFENMKNNAHNRNHTYTGGDSYTYVNEQVWKGTLRIRVIRNSETVTQITNDIATAVCLFEERDEYMPNVVIREESVIATTYGVIENNVRYNVEDITMSCDIGYRQEFNVDWFNKVEDVIFDIDVKTIKK